MSGLGRGRQEVFPKPKLVLGQYAGNAPDNPSHKRMHASHLYSQPSLQPVAEDSYFLSQPPLDWPPPYSGVAQDGRTLSPALILLLGTTKDWLPIAIEDCLVVSSLGESLSVSFDRPSPFGAPHVRTTCSPTPYGQDNQHLTFSFCPLERAIEDYLGDPLLSLSPSPSMWHDSSAPGNARGAPISNWGCAWRVGHQTPPVGVVLSYSS